MAEISKNNPEYDLYLPYWKQIRAFIKGMKGVQEYLQNVTNNSAPESIMRNILYKERAKYTNFPSRTRNALSGSVFRKDATFEIPTPLEYLIENANGCGLSLNHLAKSLVNNVLEVGRHCLFVDYDDDDKFPYIVEYNAESVRDWEMEDGYLRKVVLIKGHKKEKHLLLDKDGFYIINIVKDDVVVETIIPAKADGTRFDYIPFIFCGSTNNSPDVDDMPLWAIVDVTQGHYQNSADYEDLLRLMLPTPYMTEVTKSWFDEMYPSGAVPFGTGALLTAPQGANVGLLQANENQAHDVAMKRKEEQLIMLGARLITGNTGGVETAEAARIRFSSENSVLDNIATNCSSAIEVCIGWCGDYLNIQEDVTFELNRDFFDTKLSAQEITASVLLLDRGVYAMSDLRDNLRKSGVIRGDRTDEDINAEAEVSGGNL